MCTLCSWFPIPLARACRHDARPCPTWGIAGGLIFLWSQAPQCSGKGEVLYLHIASRHIATIHTHATHIPHTHNYLCKLQWFLGFKTPLYFKTYHQWCQSYIFNINMININSVLHVSRASKILRPYFFLLVYVVLNAGFTVCVAVGNFKHWPCYNNTHVPLCIITVHSCKAILRAIFWKSLKIISVQDTNTCPLPDPSVCHCGSCHGNSHPEVFVVVCRD